MMASVAAEGVRWPGTRAHKAESGLPGRAVHLLERPPPGRPHFDAVHDGVAEHLGQVALRALVRRRDVGWLDPHATCRQLVLAERRVDSEDLAAIDVPDGSPLRHVPAHGGERHVPDQLGINDGVGQIVPRGPHGRAPCSGLQCHECRSECATTKEEVARGRELLCDVHAPMQVVAVRLHAQECLCVHGAAPYRRRTGSRFLRRRPVRSTEHIAAASAGCSPGLRW